MGAFKRLLTLALLLPFVSAMAQTDLVKRGAAITLKVTSFTEARKQVSDLAQSHQGAVSDRHTVSSEKGHESGWMRVQVPKAELDGFLTDVRQLGTIYGEKLSYDDGSSRYQQLGERAERLSQHERRLSSVLTMKRLRGSDILYVQDRILRTTVDEDSLRDERAAIPRQAASSSVIVTLFEPSFTQDLPRTPLGHVREAFVDAGKNLAKTALDLLEPTIHLILYVFLGWLLWTIFKRPLKAAFARFKEFISPPVRPVEIRPTTDDES
jgi:hypothetical protein